MKQAVLPVLMICLLLCGCGGAAAETRLEQRRDALAEAAELRFTARVTANLGSEAFLCVLDCAATPEETTVEVLSPESVAGVRARASGGETALEYDGLRLALGGPGGGPLAAVPLIVSALKTGHVVRVWNEAGGALLAAELYASDEYGLCLRFDADSLTPVSASVSRDGTELIYCEIEDFRFS